MQSKLKIIFDKASLELPTRKHEINDEKVYFYKGFKISKSKSGIYLWKDTRLSDYYSEVDPAITNRILKFGFKKTLNEVMIFNDEERVISLDRMISFINNEIHRLVIVSTKIWNKCNLEIKESPLKKDSILKSYLKEKRKLQKERVILKSLKDKHKLDKIFFKTRIKTYNLNN